LTHPPRSPLFPYTTLFRSDARAAPLAIDVDAHRDELTVIHRVAKAPGLQSPDGVAHRVRGVVLHQAHVGAHRIQPVAPHRALDLDRKSTRLNSSHRTISYA